MKQKFSPTTTFLYCGSVTNGLRFISKWYFKCQIKQRKGYLVRIKKILQAFRLNSFPVPSVSEILKDSQRKFRLRNGRWNVQVLLQKEYIRISVMSKTVTKDPVRY